MAEKTTKIVIEFKNPLKEVLKKNMNQLYPNLLIININPNEGITLQLNSKNPMSGQIEPISVDFAESKVGIPEAYEFLINKGGINFDSFVLQEEEVAGMYRMKFSHFIALWMGELEQISMKGFEVENGEKYFYEKSVGKGQFVPHDQSFYEALIRKINEEG